MSITHLFFDLDDTLYPHSSGLWNAIRDRMNDYIQKQLDLPMDEIGKLRQRYYETYGTTLRGLQMKHTVDTQEFLAYVHDLPLEQFLQPNHDLKEMLFGLRQDKWVFTNADAAHAKRVLHTLDLDGCFTGIIDVNALGFIPKPNPQAYQTALDIARADAESSVFFDDSPRNLRGAKSCGFITVMVGCQDHTSTPEFDLCIDSLIELADSFPALWGIDQREQP